MEYFIDHYKILNLSFNATEEEIKRAFWKLAKMHHPDKGGNPYKFHQIYISYQFLMNKNKRKEYDKIYQQYKKQSYNEIIKERFKNAKIIEPSQFYYAATLKAFLDKQIHLKTIKKKDRIFLANIEYDYKLVLSEQDLERDLLFKVPIILNKICNQCYGRDLYCSYCKGLGKYKTEGLIRFFIPAFTLHSGQILKINLQNIKKSPMIYPKQKIIRILIQS